MLTATKREGSPATRRALFGILRNAADNLPEDITAGRYRVADRLFTLIEQIAICSDAETGYTLSNAYVDTIADKCRWSRRTVQRAAAIAETLGWITRTQTATNGRAGCNSWRIDWQAIARTAAAVNTSRGDKLTREGVTNCRGGGDKLTGPGCQIDTPNNKDLSPVLIPVLRPTDGRTDENSGEEKNTMSEADGWSEIEQHLKRLGVHDPKPAIESARSAGVTQNYVWELIAYYRRNSGYWNAGQLRGRIMIAENGQPIAAKWLPADQAAVNRDRAKERKREIVTQAAERAANEREAEAAERSHALRESRLGPILDAMTPEQRVELESGLSQFEKQYWSNPKTRRERAEALRRRLFDLLEAREQKQGVG